MMFESDMPTLFIIEDDAAVCQALLWLFKSTKINVEIYGSAQAFLEVYNPTRKGCLLIDVRLPLVGGLELQAKLNALGNTLPIIIITGHGDIPMAVQAMRAGAFDFITKPFKNEVLLGQIERAIAFNLNDAEEKMKFREITERKRRLTPREREVLALIIDGKLNKEIAYMLDISISTVELHRANIMQKMQARTVAELVKFYVISTPGAAYASAVV